jgi:hypothetical protein
MKGHDLQIVRSWQARQTFDGSTVAVNNRTMISTVSVMGLPIAHARRRTAADEVAENCGV